MNLSSFWLCYIGSSLRKGQAETEINEKDTIHLNGIHIRMRHFSIFVFVRKGAEEKTKKKNRPFEYSTDCMRKMRVRGAYIDFVVVYIHLYWIADTERIESFLTRNQNTFRYRNPYLRNSTVSAEMKERGNSIEFLKHKGDMAKLVDATDLIGLSLSIETY